MSKSDDGVQLRDHYGDSRLQDKRLEMSRAIPFGGLVTTFEVHLEKKSSSGYY